MKLFKVRVGDDGSISANFLVDLNHFTNSVKRGVGYIIKSDIMRQFHAITYDRWNFELIDQAKLRKRVEDVVSKRVPVFGSIEEAKKAGYED